MVRPEIPRRATNLTENQLMQEDTNIGVLFFVRPSDYRPNGLTLVGLDPTPHFTSRYCQM